MRKRIFTDFDGPIMDVSERYYQVYLYCLEKIRKPTQLINILSKSEFWELKRSQVPEKEIATISGFEDEERAIAFAGSGTALVVDDEELVRMSTAEMLIDLGSSGAESVVVSRLRSP